MGLDQKRINFKSVCSFYYHRYSRFKQVLSEQKVFLCKNKISKLFNKLNVSFFLECSNQILIIKFLYFVVFIVIESIKNKINESLAFQINFILHLMA